MPIDSIIQAALIAIALIIFFLFFVFSMLLAGTLKKRRLPDSAQDLEEKGSIAATEEVVAEPEAPPAPAEIPIYEKYDQIYRLEILYWRGVSKPWWWNNYAEDLLRYVDEYFPKSHMNYFATYNSNSKSSDYNNSLYQKRILFLRTKKISKHPLVVINYDKEYFMIDSYPALEEFKDRIDAEWYRQYKFKKTYRHSPVTYTK